MTDLQPEALVDAVPGWDWQDLPPVVERPFEVDVLFDATCDAAARTVITQISSKLPELLQAFWQVLQDVVAEGGLVADTLNPFFQASGLEIEVLWVSNPTIQAQNLMHRGKDEATDVLSFPMETTTPDGQRLLGSILVSVPWAMAQAGQAKANETVEHYLLERVTHGLLHLMGLHHDTMADYERVVGIQAKVLAHLYGSVEP